MMLMKLLLDSAAGSAAPVREGLAFPFLATHVTSRLCGRAEERLKGE